MKVFVIGSVNQDSKFIKEVADRYKIFGHEVDCVTPEPEKSFNELVWQAFDKIKVADVVLVVPKHDGSLGHGTIYEMAFAEEMGKTVELYIRDRG